MTTSTKRDQCATHAGQPAVGCRLCLIDAKVDGDADAIADWHRSVGGLEVNARFPDKWIDARVDHPAVADWVTAYTADPRSVPWLMLMGLVGRGKTHQAYAAVHAAATAGRRITWEADTASQLYEHLRPGGPDEPRAIMTRWQRVDLALIDDLGASGPLNPWAEERTTLLLNERYQRRLPTIITTNVAPDAFSDIFGDRITSRLAEACRGAKISIKGPDRRKPPEEATQTKEQDR
jgi:DNA replication protein DnaC